jgi:hypothetical protein
MFVPTTNQQWLLRLTPTRLQLPPAGAQPLGLAFDTRMAAKGAYDVLVGVA